jgi:hypothetical protein
MYFSITETCFMNLLQISDVTVCLQKDKYGIIIVYLTMFVMLEHLSYVHLKLFSPGIP